MDAYAVDRLGHERQNRGQVDVNVDALERIRTLRMLMDAYGRVSAPYSHLCTHSALLGTSQNPSKDATRALAIAKRTHLRLYRQPKSFPEN